MDYPETSAMAAAKPPQLAIKVQHSPVLDSRSRRLRWGQAVVLVTLIAWLYFEIVLLLVQDWWRDPNFSHGFVVPLFSAFLIWQIRSRLAAAPSQPSWVGLAIIVMALLMLTVGIFGAEMFLSRSSLVFLLMGMTIYLLGWSHFRLLLFPLLFLFLMIPIPAIIFNQITFPLQLLASKLATGLLQFVGVPVLREGNVIQLAAMPLEVAEACSGIRSLISLGTTAVMYGYLLEKSLFARVLLAIAAIPIAVGANALRIVGTGLLVQYWDADKALGFFHEFSGWLLFLLSLALLFSTHKLIHLVSHPVSRAPKEVAPDA